MLFGIISVFVGILCVWQVSTWLGAPILILGLVVIGRQYTEEKAPPEFRDYQSSAPTYNLKSSSNPRR